MSDPYNNQYSQQYNSGYPTPQYNSPAPGQGYPPPEQQYQQPGYPPQQQGGAASGYYGEQQPQQYQQQYGPPAQGGFQHGQQAPYNDPYQQQG
jgi:hypothetical protein